MLIYAHRMAERENLAEKQPSESVFRKSIIRKLSMNKRRGNEAAAADDTPKPAASDTQSKINSLHSHISFTLLNNSTKQTNKLINPF